MDLAVCLDAVFPEAPPEEALRLARAEGVSLVEFWDWRRRDLDALGRAARRERVRTLIFSGNTFAEPLVDPAGHPAALVHLGRSLEVARRLAVRLLVVHVGYALADRDRGRQWAAAVAGLRAAGDLAAAAGVMLALEPLNSKVDHPGYFLDTVPDALRLLADADHPAVRLLLDVYHMAVMHEDLLDRLPAVVPLTVHVHAADVPGRGEPGSGTLPWPRVVRALREGGYRGAIGLECWPTAGAAETLRRSAEVLAT